MRISIPARRQLWFLFPLAIWSCAVGVSYWIHRGSAGSGDAVGIAQVKEHRISPASLGRLASLEVVEGQIVTQGQVVARLDTELVESEISFADARLRQVVSDVRATAVSLDVSTLQSGRAFQSEIEATEIELKAAQSDSARDGAELEKLLEAMRVQRDLVRRGLAKADGLRELELRRAAVFESVRAWPSRIHAIEARLQSARARLADWRRTQTGSSEGASRKTQLQPLFEKVREQKEQLKLLGSHLQSATLQATSDAYVSSILARPGDILKPGDPVMTLVEIQPRQVIAYLEERRGDSAKPGTAVVGRRRNGSREQLEGRIVSVSGAVTQLPARFWQNPHIPAWGREFYIELPEHVRLDPGEALDLALTQREVISQNQLAADAKLRGVIRR